MQIIYKLILSIFSLFFFSNLSWANLPYYPIQLPHDDVAHYENVPYTVNNMMEWWYYNGKITTKTGRHLGYYLAFNYVQREINHKKIFVPFFGIQITDIDKKHVYGNRLYFFNKHAYTFSTEKLDVSLGKNLSLQKKGDTFLAQGSLNLNDGTPCSFSLQFKPTRDALLACKTGLIDMGDNTNSYYYSYTHLITNGYFQLGNEVLEIDPEQSLSWMDHQWGDFIVSPLSPWFWASIQLENGLELDLLVRINKKDHQKTFKWVNIVMPDDSRIYLKENEFEYLDGPILIGEKHPTSYTLKIPSIHLELDHIKALVPGQDINGIWEGISEVSGTFADKKICGHANTENNLHY